MAKMAVLIQYKIEVKKGVVTAVDEMPDNILAYIQEIVGSAQAAADAAKYNGEYTVTLWDTGSLSIEKGPGSTTGWAEVPDDVVRVTTVDEWLKLARAKQIVTPSASGDSGATELQVLRAKVKAAQFDPFDKPWPVPRILRDTGFIEWMKQGTFIDPHDIATSDPHLLRTLYGSYLRDRLGSLGGRRPPSVPPDMPTPLTPSRRWGEAPVSRVSTRRHQARRPVPGVMASRRGFTR